MMRRDVQYGRCSFVTIVEKREKEKENNDTLRHIPRQKNSV